MRRLPTFARLRRGKQGDGYRRAYELVSRKSILGHLLHRVCRRVAPVSLVFLQRENRLGRCVEPFQEFGDGVESARTSRALSKCRQPPENEGARRGLFGGAGKAEG